MAEYDPAPPLQVPAAVRWAGVLFPWVAAGRVYGPYGLSALRQGQFGAETDVGSSDVKVGLDTLLRFLVPVRLWLSLGVIVVAVKLFSHPSFGRMVEDVFTHGAITMVLGPFGVLLAAVALIATAGRGRRRSMAGRMVRPGMTAVLTVLLSVGVFGLQLPVLRQAIERALGAASPAQLFGHLPWPLQALVWLGGVVLGPWLFVFGVCAVYLMHRNGFSATTHEPLLRPIVSVWLAWMVAAVQFALGNNAGLSTVSYYEAVLAGPVLVTGLGVVEFVRLRQLAASATGTTARTPPD